MFFSFQSSESRSRKMRNKTIIAKRKKRLYTIYIDCVILTGQRYRVEIDSRKSITELYEKIKESIRKEQTKRTPQSQKYNSFELKVVYMDEGNKILFDKNNTFKPNAIPPTIGNYFGITEKQLRVLAINRAKNKKEPSLLQLYVILIKKNPEIEIIQGHTKLYIIDGTTNQDGQDFPQYVQSLLNRDDRHSLKIIQDLLEEMKQRISMIDENKKVVPKKMLKRIEMLKRIDKILTLMK